MYPAKIALDVGQNARLRKTGWEQSRYPAMMDHGLIVGEASIHDSGASAIVLSIDVPLGASHVDHLMSPDYQDRALFNTG